MKKYVAVIIIILLMIVPIAVISGSLTGGLAVKNRSEAMQFFNKNVRPNEPVKKEGGGKFRIGYVDIDPYPASGEMLYYLIEEMAEEGWIELSEELPFDSEDTDAKELINYLADRDLGPYVEFSRDANYYTAVDDKDEYVKSLKEHAQNEDLDLIICMGTSPGELVINELGITNIPIMVYFSVDPVASGLSDSEEYSGQENVWCHTSSGVYKNQLQFYHSSFDFSNIGMVYYSESVGAMSQYREAAAQMKCKITERQIETLESSDAEAVETYYTMLEETFRGLVDEGIDAFMLGTDIIKDESRIAKMLDIFYDAGIPVFVQNGEYYVKDGATMVVTTSNAKSQAPFAVNALSLILNGEKPGSIYQKYIISPYISINIDAINSLGLKSDEQLLISAERIYYNNNEDEEKK